MGVANISGNILTDSGASLSSYVPYTGATTNVDLGSNFLKARTFYSEGSGGGGSYAIKNGTTPSFEDGYTILSSNDYRLNIVSTVSAATKAVYFGFSGVTATRTYTLPDASGTLALTSNLSSYLPLTGGTLTGALSGTSATFSSSVVIGNSSTTGKQLVVNQTGTTGYFLSGEASGTEIAYWYYNASEIQFSSKASTRALTFLTSDTERMRITSGGGVMIGTSTDTGRRLYVLGSGNTSASVCATFDNSSGTTLLSLRNDGATFLSSFTYNNTVSGGVRTLYIDSTTALGGISSIRASKTNIEPITNNDWIYQLEPVTFNYRKKDEEGNYTEEYFDEVTYGLIAEDTAPIADFLINYNDKEDGTKEMVGIEYMRLITPMLKSIQEQKKLIDELNAKVTALENK